MKTALGVSKILYTSTVSFPFMKPDRRIYEFCVRAPYTANAVEGADVCSTAHYRLVLARRLGVKALMGWRRAANVIPMDTDDDGERLIRVGEEDFQCIECGEVDRHIVWHKKVVSSAGMTARLIQCLGCGRRSYTTVLDYDRPYAADV